jgi:tryptophanase
MRYIAAVLKKIYDSRDKAKRGYKIVDEAPIMRHFTVKLEKIRHEVLSQVIKG